MLVLAVAAGCGGGRSTAPADTFAGRELDPPTEPADFDLRDQEGKTVTLSGARGRAVLVTFLYTNCPDVCPLIAQELNAALGELGPDADRVRVLAVSVDPHGDNPLAVRRFVRTHRLRPQFRYLTGSETELRPVWTAYHLAVASGSSPELVTHSAYTLLVDPEGRGRAMYDAQVKADDVAHDVRLVLEPD